jgi:hypothetical protein
MMRGVYHFALLVCAAGLAGCGSIPMQTIKIPVPIECRVQTPARPAMPTEALAPSVDLDRFVAASQAEIELREGYEGELRAALRQCTAPLHPS